MVLTYIVKRFLEKREIEKRFYVLKVSLEISLMD